MIIEAIHTTVNPILTAYPLVGDIEATLPFCLYKATPEAVRDKTGIIGYVYTVEIGIIAKRISEVNTYTPTIINAIKAMTGTINDTEITSVIHTDESGVYYLAPDEVHVNDLEFKIFTNNR